VLSKTLFLRKLGVFYVLRDSPGPQKEDEWNASESYNLIRHTRTVRQKRVIPTRETHRGMKPCPYKQTTQKERNEERLCAAATELDCTREVVTELSKNRQEEKSAKTRRGRARYGRGRNLRENSKRSNRGMVKTRTCFDGGQLNITRMSNIKEVRYKLRLHVSVNLLAEV